MNNFNCDLFVTTYTGQKIKIKILTLLNSLKT